MSKFAIESDDFDKLHRVMADFQGNTENVVNDVLHNEAAPLIQEAIYRLMPTSGRKWKGKKGAAKTSNSLSSTNSNLAVTVHSTKRYGYLYFPDDGSNTRKHVGNQQFFLRGGESQASTIIDKCINRLIINIEK